MIIRKWMHEEGGVEDPDNYVTINFATNSIKSDAVILQMALVYRGVLENYYILGGDPKVNFEFTNIDQEHYCTFGLDRRKVEERICDIITSNGVEYLVYNNDFWNKRLVANNNWGHLNRIFLQLPCLPISEYEALRHWNDQTLMDFGTPIKRNFDSIPVKTKSLPKGRTSLDKIAVERGITIPQEYDGRPLVTKAEIAVMTLDLIHKNILDRDNLTEKYSTQILERENGNRVAGMGNAEPRGVGQEEKAESNAQAAETQEDRLPAGTPGWKQSWITDTNAPT